MSITDEKVESQDSDLRNVNDDDVVIPLNRPILSSNGIHDQNHHNNHGDVGNIDATITTSTLESKNNDKNISNRTNNDDTADDDNDYDENNFHNADNYNNNNDDKYAVTAEDLSKLCQPDDYDDDNKNTWSSSSREVWMTILEKVASTFVTKEKNYGRIQSHSQPQGMMATTTTQIKQLIMQLKQENSVGTLKEERKDIKSVSIQQQDEEKNGKQHDTTFFLGDRLAFFMTNVILRSNFEMGILPTEVESRKNYFGTNSISSKPLTTFCQFCWEAIQDFVLILLIVLGAISIAVEVTTHNDHDEEEGENKCTTCWIEGAAILLSVCIVVCMQAGIDYGKQFSFLRLTQSLHETNMKSVIRGGKLISIIDDDIVVGDILSVNSHTHATIPADCILLGSSTTSSTSSSSGTETTSNTTELKMDESTLTGESNPITKRPGDIILSGTTAIQGSGKMVVIAVGIHSVAGKIKARVYESQDTTTTTGGKKNEDDLAGTDIESPLFVKLDQLAKQIGIAGAICATIAFVACCILGLAVKGDSVDSLLDYLITAITVLAIAVPEGLPLAVTLALGFSSNRMTKEQNLVKHLDACETMGCATTICTDKTGNVVGICVPTGSLRASFLYFLLPPSQHTMFFVVRNRNTDSEQNDGSCYLPLYGEYDLG